MEDQKKLSKALYLMKDFYSDTTIAEETGLPLVEIQQIRQIHGLSQKKQRLIHSLQDQMQLALPSLFQAATQELNRLIVSPKTSNRDKLSAIKILTELVSRGR